MWCLMKSFVVIRVLQRFMQKKMSRTSPWRSWNPVLIMLFKPTLAYFTIWAPHMSPTYLQHFSKYLKRLVGRTLGAPVLVHSSY